MPEVSAFAALIGRVRDGDEEAARDIYERFAPTLIAQAKRRLGGGLRPKLDPEDVVQSVYRSFFGRLGDGRLRPEEYDGLWGLLTVMTARKCLNRVAYDHAGCREVGREVPIDSDADAPQGTVRDVPAPDPSPAEAAMLAETVQGLLLGLEDWQRELVKLHLQGYSQEEIGAKIGRADRTVRRVLERVRSRLALLRDEGARADAVSESVP